MQFTETQLPGVFLVEMERIEDSRGFFARSFCEEELAAHGLVSRFPQCNVSFNALRNTLRGMHYQVSPHEEDKLVRCTMGAIYDVVVDLRSGSPTYLQWLAVKLSAESRLSIFVPKGFAHGFKSLRDDTEVLYYMSMAHVPDAARGIRWNDPVIGIDWPLGEPILSERDASYLDLKR